MGINIKTTKELKEVFDSNYKFGVVHTETDSLDIIAATNTTLGIDAEILRINENSVDFRFILKFRGMIRTVYESIHCEEIIILDKNAKMGNIPNSVILSELVHDTYEFTLANVDMLLQRNGRFPM